MSRRRNNPRQTEAPSTPSQPANQQALYRSTQPSEIEEANRLQIQETQVVQAHFAGPLPLPEHLSEYEVIYPGAAERIIRMAELQADHRRATESKIVDSNIRLALQGQIFAFAIGMTALLGGIGLMAYDKSITGVATSLSALATLIGVFVWSQRQKSRELSEKTDPLTLGVEPTAPSQLPDGPIRD